jgi:Ricin-type beta-trefoil lectin domain
MEISVTLLPRVRSVASRRRGLTACAAALGTTALSLALTATPASASQYVDTIRWQDYQTSLCLDSNYAGSVYTNPCYAGGDTYQNWEFYIGTYSANFQDQQTGLCLDSNYAAAVYTDACDSNDTYQNWTGGGEGPGVTIQDYQTGLCLDSNDAEAVYTYACNWNDTYQNWNSLGT